MKTKLLCLLMFITFQVNSQIISIVGTGVNGWPPTNGPEITLSTTDNVHYAISNLAVSTGFVKFRQDYDWVYNWGTNSFPTGVGVQNGADIPTVAGIYNVSFNISTGDYAFVAIVTYPAVSITGTSVGGFGTDVDMATSDGVTYNLVNQGFTLGECKFRQDHDWVINWGATGFPTGTGTQGGANIPVPEATFNVTFNRNTGAYEFGTVSIGIIGTAVNGWEMPDVDLHTTDNVHYLLTSYPLLNGDLKFRQDDSWAVNWGGTFPAAVGVLNGTDIPITADYYDIAFNRNTLEYSFTVVALSTNEVAANPFRVYPNPTVDSWHFVAEDKQILSITVTDLVGKTVMNTDAQTIDASGFSRGVYFAQVKTADASQTLKLVKQ